MVSHPATSTILTSSSQGVVTCMHLTPSYIIVGLDNGELHVTNHEGGSHRKVKVMPRGIWCVDAWEDECVIAGGFAGVLSV